MKTIDPLFAETFAPQLSKGDQRKYQILVESVTQIALHGLTPATFTQIAQSLKTRPSHVAYYFKSREELMLATIKYVLASAQRTTVELLQKETTSKGKLRALVKGAFVWAENLPEQAHVFLLFHYFAASDKRFSELSVEFRAAAKARIEAILVEGGCSSKDAKKASEAVHAEIMGWLLEALASGVKSQLERSRKLAEEQCLRFLT